MRIVRLHIDRFRSIRRATLFPADHNVYLGPNNLGKTAVLEALNLLLNPEITTRGAVIDENDFCRMAGIQPPDELKQQYYAQRDLLSMYPGLREDHLRYLQKWGLIRPVMRTHTETYYPFTDLLLIRQVSAELQTAPFRAIVRSMQAERSGQLTFDFRIDAEPARIIKLKRSAFAPGGATADKPAAMTNSRRESCFIRWDIITINGRSRQVSRPIIRAPLQHNHSREDSMRMRTILLAGMAGAVLTVMSASAQQPVSPTNAALPEMPKQTTRTGKRVNRVIDMWLKNQPVYYAQISGGGYDQGKQMAATRADYITYEMEHGPLDFKELREFMRGLVEAGPTRTGHKTPPVIVTLVAWLKATVSSGADAAPGTQSCAAAPVPPGARGAAAGAEHPATRDSASRAARTHRERAT